MYTHGPQCNNNRNSSKYSYIQSYMACRKNKFSRDWTIITSSNIYSCMTLIVVWQQRVLVNIYRRQEGRRITIKTKCIIVVATYCSKKKSNQYHA